MPDIAEPPAETKPNFLQQFAASRPKNQAELEAIEKGVKPPPTAAPQPPAQPAAAAKPPEAPPKEPAKVEGAPAAKGEAEPSDTEWDAQFEEIAAGKKNPTGKAFKKIKESRDAWKSKLEPMEKELTELRKAPKPDTAAIKAIEKERDELKAKHDAFIVQFTPEFQQKFDTQISSTLGSLKNLMPEAEAAKLADILQLPESPYRRKLIAEATESLDTYTVAEIANVSREIQRVNRERKEAVDKAHQTLSSIAEERQKQAKESQERSQKAFEETFKGFSEGEKAIPVFQKRDGDKEWNAGVEERSRVAQVIYKGEFENDHDRAEAAAWGAAAPGILAWAKDSIAAKDAELAQAKATIERLQGANPNLNGNPPADTGGKKLTFLERMREQAIK